jgi:hypothetical protein
MLSFKTWHPASRTFGPLFIFLFIFYKQKGLKGPQVLDADSKVLKDSMSFSQVLKDGTSFRLSFILCAEERRLSVYV